MKWQVGTIAFWMLLGVCACSTDENSGQACTPPRSYWQQPQNTNVIDFAKVAVAIDREGRIFVEGVPATLLDLEKKLKELQPDDAPTTRIFLETEMGASCRVVESVRETFDRAFDCRQPYRCNEGIQDLWRKWPVPAGTPPS